MTGTRVFVVGALHLDVIVNAPRLPRLDETLMGSAVAYAFGGKGGNQAVAAARMGAPVSMAGRVGDDAFGQQLIDRLDAAGVDRNQVLRRPGASGMSAAIVDANGDYGAVVVSGANQRINPGDIRIHADTALILLQNEIPEAVNRAVVRAAAARRIPVMLNAAPARRNSDESPMEFRYLILNRIEAQDMTGKADPDAAASALIARGTACVILTLGPGGLLLGTPDGVAHHPGFAVPVISTHGAGDAFVGALAARVAQGQDAARALPFAQAAAALHVSTPVDQRAGITPDTVLAFLRTHGQGG